MGFVRTDIETAKTPKEKAELEELFQRYLQCDEWGIRAIPYKRVMGLKAPESERYKQIRPPYDVAVLLTSHPGNRKYLKAGVETHKKLGLWLTLAYDNYLDPERPDVTSNDVMPSREVMDMVDCFIMPHHQSWGGVLLPYMYLVKFGLAAVRDFPYVYCANGDCILEKPEGFPKLLELLGDADIMGIGWEENGLPKFNTTAFIAKTEAAKAMMDHVFDHLVPFETFEKYTQDIGNAECRFARAILDLGLKQVKVDPPWNTQLHKKGYGTFYELIGFRHIHAEESWAYKNREIPPDYRYMDEKFSGDDYKKVKEYWETKDVSVLDRWWPK